MSAVAGFSVRREVDAPVAFMVVDVNGRPVAELGAFLRDLAERGRSAYTQRAYALGLADFFGWLEARGVALEAVDRWVVSAYVADFRAGAKGGATRTRSALRAAPRHLPPTRRQACAVAPQRRSR